MRDPLPVAEIVHAIEGRTRLRFATRAGDTPFLSALAARLGALGLVRSVEVRVLTGSVLVLHDGPFGELANRAAADGLFTTVESAAPEAAIGMAAVQHPVPAAGALLFGALGVMQLFEKRVLPPAITLFWYAASLAREMRAGNTSGPEADD